MSKDQESIPSGIRRSYLSRNCRRASLGVSLLLITTLWLFLSPGVATPAQVTLEWDPNKEASLAGYRVHQGTQSRHYSTSFAIGKSTTYTATGLEDGQTYYFAVTAIGKSGRESGYSNEVSATIRLGSTYVPSPTDQTP